MDKLDTATKCIELIDLLQTELDNLIQENEAREDAQEGLMDEFHKLLTENDQLKDVIAQMVADKEEHKEKRHEI